MQIADVYDAIYADRGKDYAGETETLRAILDKHAQRPVRTVLDVACGTGGHLAHLRDHYTVAGVDLDPAMLAIAREKLPDIPFHEANMTTMDLGSRFDAVVCLFSAIGYLPSTRALDDAVAAMARHLRPGGVLVVEPWLKPDDLKPGHIGFDIVDRPAFKVARISRVEVVEEPELRSHLALHHLVGVPERIDYFVENIDMGLWRDDTYRDAFRAAGLEVDYDSNGLIGRGLYIGIKPVEATP